MTTEKTMDITQFIYADNNATTAVAPEVRDAILPFLAEGFYNPSSMYPPAASVAEKLREARDSIALAFNATDSSEILFTSCATESNNHVIFGAAAANPARKHIITTKVEHPAVLEVCREMERRGYRVTYLPVDRHGRLNISAFVRALEPGKTLLVSIMHANNETGVLFPVADLARITKETDPNILFHTDATQSISKVSVSLSKNGTRNTHAADWRYVDFVSCSGHKFHAPKGVGLLYIRKGARIRPYLLGGHQESGRRGGTENIPYIVGVAKALELAALAHVEANERLAKFQRDFESELLHTLDDVEINGQDAARMGNTTNISCHFVEGEAILYELAEYKICASSGSACTSGSLEPSHVLRAMGVPFTAIHGSTRFSFSRYTTAQDIDKILDVFPKIINRLRAISPFSRENAKDTRGTRE
ncbi:MAG: aminotransferase class V-fold PLP-dependent enzyme [Planctomycetia bacterium]|nr:aminotransferase class V-fold PLP-dependent enzyme [Planctomycetia bacterium]